MRRQDLLHDLNGNRIGVDARADPADANPVATATYTIAPGTNRLVSVEDAGGTRSIIYDGNGNTQGETRPGPSITADYDGYARLISYAQGSTLFSHAYNGLDDRVSTTSGADTRRFVFDADGRMLGEYGASASDVKAETIWLSPEVAANDNSPFGGDDGVGGYAPLAVASGVGGATLTWIHGNHLGVPIATTDGTGAAVSPSGYTVVGFPGQTRTFGDIYYNRYRDYDPTLGRYIQADPIGLAGGSNPYVYALANPVNFVDPDGLNPLAGGRIAWGAGEIVGQGLILWCRTNLALCMRTIGPAAIRVANACQSISDALSDGGEDGARKGCHRKCVDLTVGRGYGSDAPLRYRKCMRECMKSKGYDY